MNRLSKERKRFLSILLATLIIFSTLTYIATTPRPQEQFFQLYVLDSNRMAEKYYPNGDSNISSNTPINWYLGVTNCMGSTQMVLLKVKLGNQTLNPPDQRTAAASNLPMIAEFNKIMLNNETWEFPLNWQILEARNIDNSVYLTLKVNDGDPVQNLDVTAYKGRNFRIIIELWTFDKDSDAYIFGWKAGSERRAAWLQFWFNTTSTS